MLRFLYSGGSRIFLGGGASLLFWSTFTENCTQMKNLDLSMSENLLSISMVFRRLFVHFPVYYVLHGGILVTWISICGEKMEPNV